MIYLFSRNQKERKEHVTRVTLKKISNTASTQSKFKSHVIQNVICSTVLSDQPIMTSPDIVLYESEARTKCSLTAQTIVLNYIYRE